jgi:SH3 domain-containing protein
MRTTTVLRFALPFLFPLAALADPAVTLRATELRKEPASDAAKVADLGANAPVEALERSAGWVRVRAASGAEGWVKLLALRYTGTGDAKKGDSGFQQMISAARTGSSGTQVTTGVRGLDEEQMATARPNAAELKKLESYAATKDASSSFAQGGNLQAQRVEYPK